MQNSSKIENLFNQLKSIQLIDDVKKALNIQNDIELHDFFHNLKKIDILWNMVGIVFLKTPFLIKDQLTKLNAFNNDICLQNFTLFFEKFFEDNINRDQSKRVLECFLCQAWLTSYFL